MECTLRKYSTVLDKDAAMRRNGGIMSEALRKLAALFGQTVQKPYTALKKKEEIMLPMSDGTELRTWVFYPDGMEKGSVILQRCCYPGQAEELCFYAEEYCRRGYFYCIQWCRGINGSGGVWEPNIYDRQDGLDTLEWLCSQPFTENVGYMGNSYLAYTGWCMADAVPGKVKSMYLGVYGTDRYCSAYKDGMFRHDILTAWAKGNAGVPIEADYMESCRFRPQIEVDEKLWGVSLPWYRDWITNTDWDSEYWSSGLWKRLKDTPGKMKIPVYIREGWYDHHLGSALVTWEDLSEESRRHSTLQIGPWNHGYGPAVAHQSLAHLGDDSVQAPLDWFEKTLRKGELPEQEIKSYMIGADEWRISKEYPRTEMKQLFLPGENVSFIYDPERPVPSHGAESMLETWGEIGSLIQPECGWRKDVISFVSPVLEEELEIDGCINVKLHVSSDAEDTAFTAKVMEVFEDGTACNIRGSLTTLAYRNGASVRGTYTPGEIVEINLPMWRIAWKTQKNSRLRVDISSSDFPQYSVHSNFPGVWSEQQKTQTAVQTIWAKKQPVVLELPVVIK